VVTALLVGVAAAAVLYQTSVQPGAAIVAAVFDGGQLVTPPAGFGQLSRTVTERRVPVPVSGAPTAYLDIYTPAGGDGQPRPVVLWIHGGGFISSSAATVADYTILLAHAGRDHRRGAVRCAAGRRAVLRSVRHTHRGIDRLPRAADLPVGVHGRPRLDRSRPRPRSWRER
jgi:hypothetical protein